MGKKSAITADVTEQLSERCRCSYTGSHIVGSQLFCDNNKLIYQAEFLETSGKTLNQIRSLIREWVFSQPSISINNKPYELDSSCSVVVETPGISSCYALQPTTGSTLIPEATPRPPSPFELAAVVGVGVILLLVSIVVIGLVTFFVRRSRRKYDLNR